MKVVIAEHAGACYGVQRALDMAEQVAGEYPRSYTLGPLIHNPLVVADLEKRGVIEADSVTDIPAGTDAPVIIRSHGVTPEVRTSLLDAGFTVRDATCPHVLRAQKAAQKLALDDCTVVIVGEEGHPEVEGLAAYARAAGGNALIVGSSQELPCDLSDPAGVVVQTTQRRSVLDDVVDGLRARGIDPEVKDTICEATCERQDAAFEMARAVDAVIVIGGRNSGNTARLAQICSDVCERTHLVQEASEIDPAWFKGCTVVGVTAGASTPESHIQSVIARLETL